MSQSRILLPITCFLRTIMMVMITLAIVSADNITEKARERFYSADNDLFQYTGRIDFTNRSLPKFWAPGVYVKARFIGNSCEVNINDEVLWGKSHNYISISVDGGKPRRMKLSGKENAIRLDDLGDGAHTIIICKNTESGIGYLEFAGLKCRKLLKLTDMPERKIEFYGNSITCSTDSDQSEVACGKGEWYDQHHAYMSYGPLTARALNADWMLTAVSGIGLTRSCCNMTVTMPDVFDKVDLRDNKIQWDFSYQPDVVTICLGQNDGIQDSVVFCSKYVEFIGNIRSKYPKAAIVPLTSPMADDQLVAVMKKYISAVTDHVKSHGDPNVYPYFFSRRYSSGCGTHPSLEEHTFIATELTAHIKQIKQW